ncbi:MAG: hypothetical protein A3F09_02550 [Chlamydiae bacterium RIFCSPHIGHO2_12_FULL_49_11]|nr:MAG: hypothetical protein A3F09_02550 [Chlamydiae bacterium RIFCSPHIGHO2_12_FULL_49_11]
MLIKFPTAQPVLDSIDAGIHNRILFPLSTLQKYRRTLNGIAPFLCNEMPPQDGIDLVKKLAQRISNLIYRHTVLEFAETAEHLAAHGNELPQHELHLHISRLRRRIREFLKEHRPSQNNARFLRFASICLNRAEKGLPLIEPVLSRKICRFTTTAPTPLQEDYENAEALFELGFFLYTKKWAEFRLAFELLSQEMQREALWHIKECSGSLEISPLRKKAGRLKAVQGLLGLAHKLTHYYFEESIYPSIGDIDSMYKEVACLHL